MTKYKYANYETMPASDLIREYVVLSCAQYMFRAPLVSGHIFDLVGRTLLRRWKEIDSPLKGVVDLHALKKSTGGEYLCYDDIIVEEASERIAKLMDKEEKELNASLDGFGSDYY